MKLEITNLSAFDGIAPAAVNDQLASLSKINELTHQQASQVASAIWSHNERHREFWRGDDAAVAALLNAVGLTALQPIFVANAQAAAALNELAALTGIAERALIEPLREITTDSNGKISLAPLTTNAQQGSGGE